MHWRTYDRLCEKSRLEDWIYIEEVKAELAIVERQISNLEHRVGAKRSRPGRSEKRDHAPRTKTSTPAEGRIGKENGRALR